MAISPDMKIVTTPRVVALLVAGCFVGYFWLMNVFYTRAEAQEDTQDLKGMETRLDEHIMESTMYRLRTDMHDTEDNLWVLNEQLLVPGGNTPERRAKVHEYEQRIQGMKDLQDCLREHHTGCMVATGE